MVPTAHGINKAVGPIRRDRGAKLCALLPAHFALATTIGAGWARCGTGRPRRVASGG